MSTEEKINEKMSHIIQGLLPDPDSFSFKYDEYKNLIFAEDIHGQVYITISYNEDGSKNISKLYRNSPYVEIYTYNKDNLMTQWSDPNLTTYYYYDSDGKLNRTLDSNGYEHIITYTSTGSLEHRIYPDKTESFIMKDKNGNTIRSTDSNGVILEYSIKTCSVIYKKTPDGHEIWYNDNKFCEENQKIIHQKYPDGSEYWYDDRGNIIHGIKSTGDEYKCKYDKHDRLIHQKFSNGLEIYHKYTNFGKITHEIFPNGKECWIKINKNNEVTHIKVSEGWRTV